MIEVDTSAHGERLDHFLAAHGPTLSRARLQKLIEQGYVLVKAGVMDMFTHTTHVESIALFEKRR